MTGGEERGRREAGTRGREDMIETSCCLVLESLLDWIGLDWAGLD